MAERTGAGDPASIRAGASAAVLGVWVLISTWCALRFIALEVSPPGFFLDEALAALQLRCLAETGRSAQGAAWPLFAEGANGGLYTPTFLYSGLAWTYLFGFSIASVRGIAAAYSVATVIGLWKLARELGDDTSARLVTLAAAISPWAFQFSRIAWDPPLAPAFLVWGVWAFVRSDAIAARCAAGLLLSLAMYSYPPLRAQTPLVLLLLMLCKRGRPAGALACCLAFVAASVPLAWSSLDPRFVERTANLVILNPGYLREHGGQHPLFFLCSEILDHAFEHLRPFYLFLTGDRSLRHSTQLIGELGLLDDLALVWLLVLIYRRFMIGGPPNPGRARVLLAAAVALACGVLPAALTHEGLPHALRSIGAWPALALCTGTVCASLWSRAARAAWLIVVLAAAQTLYFVPRYFSDYPRLAQADFQAELRSAAESGQLTRLAAAGRRKDGYQLRYYLTQYFGYGCASSVAPAARIQRGLPLTD